MQTTYGDISQRTAAYAAAKMLAHAEPILVLSKFGQNKPIPRNKAQQVKFRRPIPFPISTVPLVEGATPTPNKLKYEDVPATLSQYGGLVEITDVVKDLSEDPVLMDASMLSGEQAAETIEMVTWGAIKGGTTVYYDTAAHVSRSQVDSEITLPRLRAMVRGLRAARGKPVTTMLDSSPKFGVKAIEGGFIAFGHTDMENDIRDLPGYTPVVEYGTQKPLCPEELGSVENIRILLSPLLDPWLAAGAAVGATGMVSDGAANVDVYPLVVIAKEAYGLCPLKGKEAIKPSVINPDTPSKSDPLGQVGFVGWKTYYVAKILNETWVARGEFGVTAL